MVEGSNFPALESLWRLASNRTRLESVMSHPTISDGISAREARIIAVLCGVDSDMRDKQLDPEQVTVEERTGTLPMAGETELSIIRIHPGLDHTMDSLEHSVRSIEEFMGFPFPQRHVIYLLAQIPEKASGANFGTHVSITSYEQAQSREWMLRLFAHEAGHNYW